MQSGLDGFDERRVTAVCKPLLCWHAQLHLLGMHFLRAKPPLLHEPLCCLYRMQGVLLH